MREVWEGLVSAALVGTEQKEFALPPTGSPLDGVLGRLDGAEPEAALLSAAAAVALYRRAGWQPASDPRPLPEPCELADLPPCGPAAERCLQAILETQPELLPEWLSIAAQAGRRIPDRLLPDLLDRGRRDRSLRDGLAPVLGRRGRWLAAQNPDWSYAATGESLDESVWELGGKAARVAFLGQLRAADPDRARELAGSTWAAESIEQRAAFLGVFDTGLSMADEPFLEECLDDRRKEVRQAAAQLLTRLPESRRAQRIVARAEPLLNLNRHQVIRWRVDVTLPEACDKEMVRDGIDAKAPPGQGEKAWWLIQLLGSVPPSHWCRLWGRTPAELLQAAAHGEWRPALLTGWARAALGVQDAEWAEALLTHGFDHLAGLRFEGAIRWIDLVPPERLEALILQNLRSNQGPLQGNHPALALLLQHQKPWGPDLARAVIDRARGLMADRKGHMASWEWRAYLLQFARTIPPSMAEEFATGWPDQTQAWQVWEPVVNEFLARLRFRAEMLELT